MTDQIPQAAQHQLNDDCWLETLKHLPPRDVILSIRAVDRRLHLLSLERDVWLHHLQLLREVMVTPLSSYDGQSPEDPRSLGLNIEQLVLRCIKAEDRWTGRHSPPRPFPLYLAYQMQVQPVRGLRKLVFEDPNGAFYVSDLDSVGGCSERRFIGTHPDSYLAGPLIFNTYYDCRASQIVIAARTREKRHQLDFLSPPVLKGNIEFLGSLTFPDRVIWPWFDDDMLICQLYFGGEVMRGQLIVLDWRAALKNEEPFRLTSMQLPSSPSDPSTDPHPWNISRLPNGNLFLAYKRGIIVIEVPPFNMAHSVLIHPATAEMPHVLWALSATTVLQNPRSSVGSMCVGSAAWDRIFVQVYWSGTQFEIDTVPLDGKLSVFASGRHRAVIVTQPEGGALPSLLSASSELYRGPSPSSIHLSRIGQVNRQGRESLIRLDETCSYFIAFGLSNQTFIYDLF